MQLVQSFISIAQEAAKQQTCQLNADSNVKAQPQLQQVRVDGRLNDLFTVKPSGVGDKSASFKP